MNRCPCCGYFTFGENYPGSYEICPVCYWEDDEFQLNDSGYAVGANRVCLNEARINYSMFGASSREVIEFVRKPNEEEFRG